MWNPRCAESCVWNLRCGALSVEPYVWNAIRGVLFVERRAWNPMCVGTSCLGPSMWNPTCGPLCAEAYCEWSPTSWSPVSVEPYVCHSVPGALSRCACVWKPTCATPCVLKRVHAEPSQTSSAPFFSMRRPPEVWTTSPGPLFRPGSIFDAPEAR